MVVEDVYTSLKPSIRINNIHKLIKGIIVEYKILIKWYKNKYIFTQIQISEIMALRKLWYMITIEFNTMVQLLRECQKGRFCRHESILEPLILLIVVGGKEAFIHLKSVNFDILF